MANVDVSQTKTTYCRICEAICGLRVEMVDGRLTRLMPDKSHPLSQGFICAKGVRFLETADHPDRLLHPQLRQPDGHYAPLSWGEVINQIGGKLKTIYQQHGPHAIALYFGTPFIHNVMGIVTIHQLARAIGTRNLYSAGSQDNNNKLAASEIIHGSGFIHPIPDLERANVALFLGTNPFVSQSSFLHAPCGTAAYDQFIARGGRLFIADPRRSESVERWCKNPADHLCLRPGTDIFLLLTLINELRRSSPLPPNFTGLDEWLAMAAAYPVERAAVLTGLTAGQIVDVAAAIQQAKATTFHLSVGVNQGPFGTLCYIAMQLLVALTGNFNQPGGLLYQPLARWLDLLLGTGVGPAYTRIGLYPLVLNAATSAVLADEILSPGAEQIRALIVVAGDPVTSIPGEAKLREAFQSLELLVSLDLFANETGRLAHMQLPATSWLERWDLASWHLLFQSHPLVQYSPPMRLPPGETRTETEILAAISVAMGKPLFGSRWLANLWGKPGWNRFMPALLDGLFWLWRRHWQGARGIPWFRPRTGQYKRKVCFWHERLEPERERLARFATQTANFSEKSDVSDRFILLGRRRRRGQNSWLHGGVHGGKAEAFAWLCPEDMARLGLAKGEKVWLGTAVGELTLPIHPQPGIPPGIVVVPHGLPGSNVNRIISSDQVEPVSGMHRLQGMPVTVRKVS